MTWDLKFHASHELERLLADPAPAERIGHYDSRTGTVAHIDISTANVSGASHGRFALEVLDDNDADAYVTSASWATDIKANYYVAYTITFDTWADDTGDQRYTHASEGNRTHEHGFSFYRTAANKLVWEAYIGGTLYGPHTTSQAFTANVPILIELRGYVDFLTPNIGFVRVGSGDVLGEDWARGNSAGSGVFTSVGIGSIAKASGGPWTVPGAEQTWWVDDVEVWYADANEANTPSRRFGSAPPLLTTVNEFPSGGRIVSTTTHLAAGPTMVRNGSPTVSGADVAEKVESILLGEYATHGTPPGATAPNGGRNGDIINMNLGKVSDSDDEVQWLSLLQSAGRNVSLYLPLMTFTAFEVNFVPSSFARYMFDYCAGPQRVVEGLGPVHSSYNDRVNPRELLCQDERDGSYLSHGFLDADEGAYIAHMQEFNDDDINHVLNYFRITGHVIPDILWIDNFFPYYRVYFLNGGGSQDPQNGVSGELDNLLDYVDKDTSSATMHPNLHKIWMGFCQLFGYDNVLVNSAWWHKQAETVPQSYGVDHGINDDGYKFGIPGWDYFNYDKFDHPDGDQGDELDFAGPGRTNGICGFFEGVNRADSRANHYGTKAAQAPLSNLITTRGNAGYGMVLDLAPIDPNPLGWGNDLGDQDTGIFDVTWSAAVDLAQANNGLLYIDEGYPVTVPNPLAKNHDADYCFNLIGEMYGADHLDTTFDFYLSITELSVTDREIAPFVSGRYSSLVTVSGLTPGATYYWAYDIKNQHGTTEGLTQSFTVVAAPATPTYVSPNQGENVEPGIVTLTWDAVADPEGPDDFVAYRVWASVKESEVVAFSDNVILASHVWREPGQSTASTTMTIAQGETWYWRVMAMTEGGATAAAGTRNFDANIPPTGFAITKPTPSETDVAYNPGVLMSWGESTDPDGSDTAIIFDVYMGTNQTLVVAQDFSVLRKTGLAYDDRTDVLVGGGVGHETHYAMVVAEDQHGGRTASGVVTFTTENLAPSTPSGLLPAGAGAPSSPTLSWNASTDPESDDPVEYRIALKVGLFSTPEWPTDALRDFATGITEPAGQLNASTWYTFRVWARDSYTTPAVSLFADGVFETTGAAPAIVSVNDATGTAAAGVTSVLTGATTIPQLTATSVAAGARVGVGTDYRVPAKQANSLAAAIAVTMTTGAITTVVGTGSSTAAGSSVTIAPGAVTATQATAAATCGASAVTISTGAITTVVDRATTTAAAFDVVPSTGGTTVYVSEAATAIAAGSIVTTSGLVVVTVSEASTATAAAAAVTVIPSQIVSVTVAAGTSAAQAVAVYDAAGPQTIAVSSAASTAAAGGVAVPQTITVSVATSTAAAVAVVVHFSQTVTVTEATTASAAAMAVTVLDTALAQVVAVNVATALAASGDVVVAELGRRPAHTVSARRRNIAIARKD